MSSGYPPHSQGYNGATNTTSADDLNSGTAREADDIDELIRMAEAGIKPPKKGETPSAPLQPETPVDTSTPVPESTEKIEPAAKAEVVEKKAKKDKPIKMVYSDNEFSPEERMAKMPRYAFVPAGKTESPLADTATLPGVASTVAA